MKLERTVLCAIGATLMACGGVGDDADGVERDLANYDLSVPVTLADLEEDPDVADSEGWGVYTQLVDEGDFVTADVTYSDNALGDVGAPSE